MQSRAATNIHSHSIVPQGGIVLLVSPLQSWLLEWKVLEYIAGRSRLSSRLRQQNQQLAFHVICHPGELGRRELQDLHLQLNLSLLADLHGIWCRSREPCTERSLRAGQ